MDSTQDTPRTFRAIFDFSGESWQCLSTQNITSKISNRCTHKSHGKNTHILSRFTQQFSEPTSVPPQIFNDEEWSQNSESQSSDGESECNFEGHRTESNPERPTSALLDHVDMHVGIEDLHKADQESATASQRCEFFDLSPR